MYTAKILNCIIVDKENGQWLSDIKLMNEVAHT